MRIIFKEGSGGFACDLWLRQMDGRPETDRRWNNGCPSSSGGAQTLFTINNITTILFTSATEKDGALNWFFSWTRWGSVGETLIANCYASEQRLWWTTAAWTKWRPGIDNIFRSPEFAICKYMLLYWNATLLHRIIRSIIFDDWHCQWKWSDGLCDMWNSGYISGLAAYADQSIREGGPNLHWSKLNHLLLYYALHVPVMVIAAGSSLTDAIPGKDY